MDPEKYLSRVFGPEALRVQVEESEGVVKGFFALSELDGLNPPHPNVTRLMVTQADTAGHFKEQQTKTLPASAMVELGTGLLVGGRKIGRVEQAEFKKIVIPGDVIEVVAQGEEVTIKREFKEVAAMRVVVSNMGASPRTVRAYSEIAAQTLAAQVALDFSQTPEPLCPLVLAVGRMSDLAEPEGSILSVRITEFQTGVKGNRLLTTTAIGSAEITDNTGKRLAVVDSIGFEFQTPSRIRQSQAIGRMLP